MERTEGEHHRTEVLGRLQLEMLQRAHSQRGEHHHAEGFPRRTGKSYGKCHRRQSVARLLQKHDRGNSAEVAPITREDRENR